MQPVALAVRVDTCAALQAGAPGACASFPPLPIESLSFGGRGAFLSPPSPMAPRWLHRAPHQGRSSSRSRWKDHRGTGRASSPSGRLRPGGRQMQSAEARAWVDIESLVPSYQVSLSLAGRRSKAGGSGAMGGLTAPWALPTDAGVKQGFLGLRNMAPPQRPRLEDSFWRLGRPDCGGLGETEEH